MRCASGCAGGRDRRSARAEPVLRPPPPAAALSFDARCWVTSVGPARLARCVSSHTFALIARFVGQGPAPPASHPPRAARKAAEAGPGRERWLERREGQARSKARREELAGSGAHAGRAAELAEQRGVENGGIRRGGGEVVRGATLHAL